MLLVSLIIGVVLIVAAIRNSQAALFTALGQDVPEFVVWGAALVAVGAVGYVPGLKVVSRALLGLVLLVIILNNYQAIISGLKSTNISQPASGGSASPAASEGGAASGSGSGLSLGDASDAANAFGSSSTMVA